MKYKPIYIKELISIDCIYTIHFFEYRSDFYFEGEEHDFWEFIYVDNGSVEVTAGEKKYWLNKGEIIFHEPNEFHNVKSDGNSTPNLVVVSFASASSQMEFFKKKKLAIGDREHELLAQIILEAKKTYASRLEDPYYDQLKRKDIVPFGSEQLIQLYLQQFLILLVRKNTQETTMSVNPLKASKKEIDNYIYRSAIEYMEKHIHETLTVDKICKDIMIGKAHLQKIFREKNLCGVIQYFVSLKIETAKKMIRKNDLNFTQIADALGYNSIHYFSRQFKQIVNMTPSEYASSINFLSKQLEERESGETAVEEEVDMG